MPDPNTSSSASEADNTIEPGDVMSRLEAAGIEDEGDRYENLAELGLTDEQPADDAQPLEGKGETPDELDETLDEEGKPKPPPEDALGLNGKGTREAPLRHKDLPTDRFIELKTPSGERVVMSLKDAVAGTFMSRDMVRREVSIAKEAQTRAETLGKKAVEHMREANRQFANRLKNPQLLVESLAETDDGMRVLHHAARAYALMRKDPSLREGLLATIRERRVAAQSQDVERRRKALEQQEQERAQQSELERTLAPAYRRGLKEAGILRQEDVTDELRDGIRMRYQFVMGKHQRPPTPEEMRWCVTDAAKALRAEGKLKAPAKPRAAPTPPAPPPGHERKTNGQIDWTKVPESVRMRDPRFLFNKEARAQVRGAS